MISGSRPLPPSPPEGATEIAKAVSETDLQAIAERGSAASTDHDQQAQAVGSFSHRVTVTRHLLRLEKFDNRHSTHGLVAKLIEQA